jgi:hypothetical protein
MKQTPLHPTITGAYLALRAACNRYVIALLVSLACLPASHAAVCSLDVDGNGRLDGTTDGLLIVRYLLGIRGGALISGALGNGATRTLASDIETHLSTPCAQAGWVGRGTGRLNDTGMVQGVNYPTGNNVGCTSSNAAIALQDCSNGRDANAAFNDSADGAAGFSFSKISNTGAVLPNSAILGSDPNQWGCTFDNVTGLMWENKTGFGLRNAVHTYTWYSSDGGNNRGATGIDNGGSCADALNCDTEKYVARVNANGGMCGHNDWRMPHVKELESIANLGAFSPAIDSNFFPNTLAANYWSATPYANSTIAAWYVRFEAGSLGSANRGDAYLVRLVRAGQ